MTENPSITLAASGFQAVIEPDRWTPGSFTLVVDGTPQSHVNLDDPTHLFFEYVQRIGHVIDQLASPGAPITAVHLGAGALTLPRYIHATRPGSRQQVIELESDLVDFVRTHLPLPRNASIRVRHGDARAVAAALPQGLRGAADLVVVDVFSGARTPAHVTSIEFYSDVITLLAADGVIAVNVADGPGLAFARSQAATLRDGTRPCRGARRDADPQRAAVRQRGADRVPRGASPRLDAEAPGRRPASVEGDQRAGNSPTGSRARRSSPTPPQCRHRRLRGASSRPDRVARRSHPAQTGLTDVAERVGTECSNVLTEHPGGSGFDRVARNPSRRDRGQSAGRLARRMRAGGQAQRSPARPRADALRRPRRGCGVGGRRRGAGSAGG